MTSLSHLHKKQLEEFEEKFPNSEYFENHARLAFEGADEKVKSYITDCNLSTLQAVWKMLEGERRVVNKKLLCWHYEEGFNEGITVQQKKIEEEIIKIKENE